MIGREQGNQWPSCANIEAFNIFQAKTLLLSSLSIEVQIKNIYTFRPQIFFWRHIA